eukprot:scaffold1233_cov395-Prasinococcus_capsulatus_cf.AAC.34
MHGLPDPLCARGSHVVGVPALADRPLAGAHRPDAPISKRRPPLGTPRHDDTGVRPEPTDRQPLRRGSSLAAASLPPAGAAAAIGGRLQVPRPRAGASRALMVR